MLCTTKRLMRGHFLSTNGTRRHNITSASMEKERSRNWQTSAQIPITSVFSSTVVVLRNILTRRPSFRQLKPKKHLNRKTFTSSTTTQKNSQSWKINPCVARMAIMFSFMELHQVKEFPWTQLWQRTSVLPSPSTGIPTKKSSSPMCSIQSPATRYLKQ